MQVHSDHRGAIAAQGQRDRRHSLGESVAPEWPRIWLEESHRVQDKAEVPVTVLPTSKVDPWGYGNNGMDDYLFGGC